MECQKGWTHQQIESNITNEIVTPKVSWVLTFTMVQVKNTSDSGSHKYWSIQHFVVFCTLEQIFVSSL